MASDLSQQVDDLVQRMDDSDQSIQDFSDSLDTNLTDIQSAIDEQAQNIETLNESAGQLTFPLSQDTIDLIKEQFPSGFITLVAGTITLKDPRISPTSNIFLSVSQAGGIQGFLSYTASAGQAIINSTSATETSVISYLILN